MTAKEKKIPNTYDQEHGNISLETTSSSDKDTSPLKK